jgi:hypothetical protein
MSSLVLVLLLAAPEFQVVEEVDGIRVEARARVGSKFVELRFTTASSASVESLCEAVFGDGKIPADEHTVRLRKVLRESADERVLYDVVTPPVVSERDYVVKVTRVRSSQRCAVRFALVTDCAEAPPPGAKVRMTALSGEWAFVPVGGQTSVEYVSHSEPGGDLPPFLVEGARRATELDLVRRVLARAVKKNPASSTP